MNDLEKRSNNTELEQKEQQRLQPFCSICEEDGSVQLTLEMPGVDKTGIEVSVENNELVINGTRSASSVNGKYLIRERSEGNYRKRFIIDESIDQDRIEAVMEDGVLSLKLFTKETAKPKKIEIK